MFLLIASPLSLYKFHELSDADTALVRVNSLTLSSSLAHFSSLIKPCTLHPAGESINSLTRYKRIYLHGLEGLVD